MLNYLRSVRSVRGPPPQPSVQLHGCWSLMSLAVNETAAARCVILRGLEAVIAAMRVHSTNPAVQARAATPII